MGTLTFIPAYATLLQWKWLRRKSKRPAKTGPDEEYVCEEITIRVCGGVHLLMRAYVETRGKPQVLSSVSLHLILLRKDLLLDPNAHLPLHCLDSQLLRSTCFLPNTAVTVMYHKAWVLCKFWIHTLVLTLAQQACYPIPPVHLLSLYLDSFRRRVAVEDNVENLTGNCEEQSESNLSLLRAPRPSLFSASVEKCLDSQG